MKVFKFTKKFKQLVETHFRGHLPLSFEKVGDYLRVEYNLVGVDVNWSLDQQIYNHFGGKVDWERYCFGANHNDTRRRITFKSVTQ